MYVFSNQPGPNRLQLIIVRCKVHLNSSLSEIDPACQVLSNKGIWVVCPFKHSLQRLQLAAVECGSIPPLFPLLLFF